MHKFDLEDLLERCFPLAGRIRTTDVTYADGIDAGLIAKEYRKWKYGTLGLFAPAPLYHKEGQDCDDEVRAFVVWFRRRNRIEGKALPIFHLGDIAHAYVGYVAESGDVRVLDLNDGILKPDAVIDFVEMV
ncbi:MAG: hypothetical protein EOM20_03345 [Spartobacteria bacterium]|nr:hypothetical protein [Spartobacteria bacterium]